MDTTFHVASVVLIAALAIGVLVGSRMQAGGAMSRMIRAKQAGLDPKTAQASLESGQRFWIAMIVVLLSALMLAILVVLGAIKGGDQQNIRDLMSVVLPVIGTWVGTVLAFYFARENLQAASETARELMQGKAEQVLSHIPARVGMIARKIIEGLKLAAGEDDTSLKLDKLGAIVDKGFSRVVIFNADDSARYVVHKSMLYEAATKAGKPLAELTLKDMVEGTRPAPPEGKGGAAVEVTGDASAKDKGDAPAEDKGGAAIEGKGAPAYRETLTRLKFVAQDASLQAAKQAMEQLAGCQDVIVTKTGTHNEPVLGWITNVDIERFSKV